MMAKKKTSKKDTKAPTSVFEKQMRVLEDDFGGSVLETLESLQAIPVRGISSGSLGIDYILSPRLGGMRKGMMLQMWGPPGCGKTTLALGFAANATARGEKVIFVDAEKTLDPDLVESSGVQSDNFWVLRKEAEVSANLLYRMLQTGEIGVVIIDSIAAWKPHPKAKAEKDVDITHDKIAASSSFISTTLPRIADICADNNVLLIVINQVRNNLGNYMGGLKPFGGWCLEHYLAASIRLSGRVQSSSSQIIDPNTKKPVGQFVTAKCDKSKIGIPMKEVTVPLFLGIGVQPHMELAELATSQTNVLAGSAGYFRWGDEPDGEIIVRGKDALIQKLYSEPEFFQEVRTRVIKELELQYKDGFVNPFLNEDGTPKTVKYNEVDDK
jgi:protein RecA